MGRPCEFPRVFLSSESCKPQLQLKDEIFTGLGPHEGLGAKNLMLKEGGAKQASLARLTFD